MDYDKPIIKLNIMKKLRELYKPYKDMVGFEFFRGYITTFAAVSVGLIIALLIIII